jgi:hypothetical protein
MSLSGWHLAFSTQYSALRTSQTGKFIHVRVPNVTVRLPTTPSPLCIGMHLSSYYLNIHFPIYHLVLFLPQRYFDTNLSWHFTASGSGLTKDGTKIFTPLPCTRWITGGGCLIPVVDFGTATSGCWDRDFDVVVLKCWDYIHCPSIVYFFSCLLFPFTDLYAVAWY